jgi:hypothetical protein
MVSQDHETAGSLPKVLRPGVLIPVACYTAAVASAGAAVVLAVIAPDGGGHRLPAAGDWNALSGRLIAGIVLACCAWLFHQIASNRVVLGDTSMQIATLLLRWTVRRDEVTEVRLTPSALEIALTDGCVVRPSMFWSTPAGGTYFALGLFRNAMSRSTIRAQILSWRQPPAPAAAEMHARFWPCRRHWRTRPNPGLLAVLVGAVAVEAVLVTAFA